MVYDVAVEEGFGDVYTLEDFLGCVKVGAFIPDDGVGYFGTESHYSWEAYVWSTKEVPEGATHVHWFNK